MALTIQIGRFDGSGPDTVTPSGTTLAAAAGVLTGGVNFALASAGNTAVRLPLNAQLGSPITVVNTASTATALLVFPPLNAAGAAAGGRVFGTATTVSADASTSIPQGKSATFWPHANGIDFTVVIGA